MQRMSLGALEEMSIEGNGVVRSARLGGVSGGLSAVSGTAAR